MDDRNTSTFYPFSQMNNLQNSMNVIMQKIGKDITSYIKAIKKIYPANTSNSDIETALCILFVPSAIEIGLERNDSKLGNTYEYFKDAENIKWDSNYWTRTFEGTNKLCYSNWQGGYGLQYRYNSVYYRCGFCI